MAVKRNLIGNFLGQGWVAAMSLAFVPVYVAHLGVEAYALIGFYAVLQGWLALLDLGMSPTLNREFARASAGAHTATSIADLLRSIEIVCFSIAATVTIVLWLSSGWLGDDWFDPQTLSRTTVANAIAVMALVVGLRFCEGIYRGALMGMERQVWYNSIIAVLATIRYAGAAAIIVWVSPTIEAFFWCQAVMSLVTVTALAIATHHWMPRSERAAHFSIETLKTIAAFAGGLSLTTLTGLLLTHVDKLFLARLLSMDVFGQYMLAVAVSGLFPMLIMPVAAAFYPPLTKAVVTGVESEIIRHYHTAAELAALVLMPAMAVCVLLPNTLILAWTGNADLAAEVGPLLRYLSIGVAFNSLLQIPFALQLAHGWTNLALKINCVAVVILLPSEYLAAQHFGAVGAAFVWALVNVALLPAGMILMHRRLLTTEWRKWAYHEVVIPMACSLAVVGIVMWLAPDASSRLGALEIVVGAGLAALAGVSACLPTIRRRLYSLIERSWKTRLPIG